MRRGIALSIIVVVALGLLLGPLSPAHARARWKHRIDKLAKNRPISISVRDKGEVLYRWNARKRRTPASVEKLLTSMVLLDKLGTDRRFTTTAAAPAPAAGVVRGNLWLLGNGDPTVTGGGRFGRSLGFRPTRLRRLAYRIREAGIVRIRGRVMGGTGIFARDWWAPGWKSDFPSRYVPFPSALNFEGNVHKGRHINDPERRAARNLKRKLQRIGVEVTRGVGTGKRPAGLQPLAKVRSVPLSHILRFMNRKSSNFFAEVLGKVLGHEVSGTGSIAAGARALKKWTSENNVGVDTFDGSGLSYSNRMSSHGMTRLLSAAEKESWGPALRRSLAKGGQGTLKHRLKGTRVRAKTGTLTSISALSGWVWLERTGSWAEFAILSSGMPKSTAVNIEDRVVRILNQYARSSSGNQVAQRPTSVGSLLPELPLRAETHAVPFLL
jgi:D-alanyl-D-alanine carboxypeptidase